MKVKFLDKINYQTYPITDDMIEVSEQELKEIGKTKCFENGKLVYYVPIKSNKERIQELKQFLKDTDYQAIKFAEGQLTYAEYEPMKIQRQAWRDEINELEKLI